MFESALSNRGRCIQALYLLIWIIGVYQQSPHNCTLEGRALASRSAIIYRITSKSIMETLSMRHILISVDESEVGVYEKCSGVTHLVGTERNSDKANQSPVPNSIGTFVPDRKNNQTAVLPVFLCHRRRRRLLTGPLRTCKSIMNARSLQYI